MMHMAHTGTSAEEVTQKAFEYVKHSDFPPNAAAIFDIDGTLLDAAGRPIVPVVSLYNYVRSRGITPFIVTARLHAFAKYTEQQLNSNGITGYKAMYMRPSLVSDPGKGKLASRRHIAQQRYTAILSIGDMPFDVGAYGGIGFLVPI